jgi:peptidoglycan hydrolase CwlO-like protein
MARAGFLTLLTALLIVTGGGLVGQDRKEDKKPADPPVRVKGKLPPNWSKLGLTDSQVQEVYKVQNKYNEEIDKLEAKIKELKATRDRESKAILTPEQKKRLDEILTGKGK